MFAELAVVVAAGLLGPILAYGRRALLPVVVGELVAGAVLGRTGFQVVDPTASVFPVFYGLGFAMLMLTAGTHVNLRDPGIRSGATRGALALLVVAAMAAPLGLLIGLALRFPQPALLAVLLAGSSAAVAFPIIEERNLQGAAVSFLMAWIAIADSATVIVMPLTLGGGNVAAVLGGDALVVGSGLLILVAGIWLERRRPAHEMVQESQARGWAVQLRMSVLLLLLLGTVAEKTGASNLVAGFLAGIILMRLGRPERLALQISGVANGFFVPIFFVLLGAELDLRALATEPSALLLTAAMAAGAVVIHVVAALATAPSRRLATGLAASAQLGLPAAAASLGLRFHTLHPAVAAALVAAGCLTLIPAAIGGSRLADDRDEPSEPRHTNG